MTTATTRSSRSTPNPNPKENTMPTTFTPAPTSPGQALDILIGLHLTDDDMDPSRLPAWAEPSRGLPGVAVGNDSDGATRAGRNWAGHLEIATPWWSEGHGNEGGWVVYTWATRSVAIASSMAELSLR